MPVSRKFQFANLMFSVILLLSACGPSQSAISTAVAQTVEARDTQTALENQSTETPTPSPDITLTPVEVTPTETPSAVASSNCTTSASLIGETIPDGTILTPGETFFKTWSLQNTGTCTWNRSYKLIYWNGDLMGGLVSYAFPEEVPPGVTKDVTILLKTPDDTGNYAGYWKIQTPWGSNFGVGEYDQPFYVKIMVSTTKNQKYAITSVTYNIVRDPAVGCPRFVYYTIYATITTNGPYEFNYFWEQIDENNSNVEHVKLRKAESMTVSREWRWRKGDNPNPKWMRIVVNSLDGHFEYEKAVFQNPCP